VEEKEKMHLRIAGLYNWQSVAQQTEVVYYNCIRDMTESKPRDVLLRYQQKCGVFWGKMLAVAWIIDWILLQVLNWLTPA
jgi:hypothetical protein